MIIGIRHLPTPLNKQHVLQGSIDTQEIILSVADLELIQENKRKIEALQLNKLTTYCSELKRTQLTAANYGFDEYVISPFLNELSFGEFEGKPKADFLKEAGDTWFQNVYESPLKNEIQVLESNIDEFLRLHRDENCLLFTHGAFLRGLCAKLKHGDLSRMNQVEIKNNELIFPNLEV